MINAFIQLYSLDYNFYYEGINAFYENSYGFNNKIKYSIVLNGNWHKFSQNPRLCQFLLSTGKSVLVEASPYDTIWGIGLSANELKAAKPINWEGQNLLGFALMEVRDELRKVREYEGICDWSLVKNNKF